MILHIVHDEKFIDTAYRIFEEVAPGNNEFVIISKNHDLKYIKKTPIRFVEERDLTQSAKKYELVLVHNFNSSKLGFVAYVDPSVKLLWIGWGADYYDLITGDMAKLYRPKTFSLYYKNRQTPIKAAFRNFKVSLKSLFSKKIQKKNIIDRFNYFAPVLHEDYLAFKKSFPHFEAEYIPWNYGTLEDDMIRGFEDSLVSGNNILLGNSAAYSNNHLDLFESLSKLDLKETQIITPLSYGDKKCRKEVIKVGQEIFGDRFKPLTDFMPIKDYIDLLASCSVAVMGHKRQQGLGNIIIMLYMGAKVFLDKENPVYSFFIGQGAHIYHLDELETESRTKLSLSEIEHNRSILKMHWTRNVILEKTKNLIHKGLS